MGLVCRLIIWLRIVGAKQGPLFEFMDMDWPFEEIIRLQIRILNFWEKNTIFIVQFLNFLGLFRMMPTVWNAHTACDVVKSLWYLRRCFYLIVGAFSYQRKERWRSHVYLTELTRKDDHAWLSVAGSCAALAPRRNDRILRFSKNLRATSDELTAYNLSELLNDAKILFGVKRREANWLFFWPLGITNFTGGAHCKMC